MEEFLPAGSIGRSDSNVNNKKPPKNPRKKTPAVIESLEYYAKFH
jgi:hypothetical protein